MLMSRYPQAGIRIINSGIPGDTAPGGLFRLQQDALSYTPDLVLVQFALNDAFCGCSLGEFRRSIEAIIERIRQESSAEVLLLTSTLPADPLSLMWLLRFTLSLERHCAREGVWHCPVDEHWRDAIAGGCDHEQLVLHDRVHPSEAGYRLMAEAVMVCLGGC